VLSATADHKASSGIATKRFVLTVSLLIAKSSLIKEEIIMKNAVLVTKDYRYYPVTRYEANRYLVDHGITEFECHETKGCLYFYIKEDK
jgi:hypothetical protein